MTPKRHCSLLSATLLLLAAIVAGCSSDDDGFIRPDAPAVEPGMRIAVADAVRSSRADGDPVEQQATLSNELIRSWWMAFVKDNTIAAITPVNTCAESGVTSDALTGFTVLPGSYTVYGFANITPAELAAATGLNIAVGQTAAFDGARFNNLQRPANTGLIPMTGKTADVTITTGGDNNFTVNVTRVFGKVEMTLRNESALPLTLTSLTFGPVSNGGAVPLMPGSAIAAPYLPAEMSLPVPAEGVSVAANATSDAIYSYVRESALDDDGQFAVSTTFTRQREGVTDPQPEIFRALIPATTLNSIARNEWIHIPLVVNNYIFRALVRFYPPIGGFPAYTVDEETDGCVHTTFHTPGVFTILPSLYRDTEPDTPLLSTSYTLDRIEVLGVDGNAVPEGFFTVTPSQDATTREITGEIGSVDGTVELRLTFTVTHTDGDTTYTHTYTRSVFITRASSTSDITMHFYQYADGTLVNNVWTSIPSFPQAIRFTKVTGSGEFGQFTRSYNGNNVQRIGFKQGTFAMEAVDEDYYIKSVKAEMSFWRNTNTSTHSRWTPSSFFWTPGKATPQGVLDIPSPTISAEDVYAWFGVVNFTEAGSQTVTFNYSTGSHRLNIAGVDVLDLDGNVLTSDYHYGYTGSAQHNKVYTIHIPAVGQYILRYFVITRDFNSNPETITASGNVQFSKAVQSVNSPIAIAWGDRMFGVICNENQPTATLTAYGTSDNPIKLVMDPSFEKWLLFWEFDVVVAKKL